MILNEQNTINRKCRFHKVEFDTYENNGAYKAPGDALSMLEY